MQVSLKAEKVVSFHFSWEAKCTTTAPLMVLMMASPGAPPRLTVTETTFLEGATMHTVQHLQLLSLRVRFHHKIHNIAILIR